MELYKKIKQRALKDPAFKKAYDDLGPEFELIEMIIAKRIERGMTQAALAKKVGTKQSAIARLESGSYNPTFSFIQKIGKALDARIKISLL